MGGCLWGVPCLEKDPRVETQKAKQPTHRRDRLGKDRVFPLNAERNNNNIVGTMQLIKMHVLACPRCPSKKHQKKKTTSHKIRLFQSWGCCAFDGDDEEEKEDDASLMRVCDQHELYERVFSRHGQC